MPPPVKLPESFGDGRIRLRQLAQADLEPWVGAFAEDPRLGVMVGSDRDPTLDDLRARLKRRRDRTDATAGAEYVIADAASDQLLGAVSLFKLDWHALRGEIGIWLRREARAQGHAATAMTLMLDLAFAHLGLERIEMTATPDNERLGRLAQRLGFEREGLLRSRNVERGRRVDVVFLGLLRGDWAARHAP